MGGLYGGGIQLNVGIDVSEPHHLGGDLKQLHSLPFIFLLYKMGIITIPHKVVIHRLRVRITKLIWAKHLD